MPNINLNDPRVKQTSKSIRMAMSKLLDEKDMSHITIKELSERAHINRKTFYNYYSSTQDIILQLEDELIHELSLRLEHWTCSFQSNNLTYLFQLIGYYIEYYNNLYPNLIICKLNSSFHLKLNQLLHNPVKDGINTIIGIQSSISDELLSIYTDYHVSGLLSAYLSCIQIKDEEKINEVTIILEKLFLQGLKGLLM